MNTRAQIILLDCYLLVHYANSYAGNENKDDDEKERRVLFFFFKYFSIKFCLYSVTVILRPPCPSTD